MTNVPSTIGRYSIVKALGHGAMGLLYLAWDASLERLIAIKVLNEDDDDLRERFAREAKAAARLRHPHIVTIFDLGEHDGQPYIAMEYIHGRTLAQIIRAREHMPLDRTLELMAELCDGLAFAHRAGIVHRDVKPANIMVDEQGSLKILDFGIARLAESAGMTQAGIMIGTLNYMSPEQISGRAVDHRSDIFAVGLVFYELLTQKAAFTGTISTGILAKVLHSEPVPLAEECPGLDEDVIRIVGRAIEKDVNHRYQDLNDMRREILAARGHIGSPASQIQPQSRADPAAREQTPLDRKPPANESTIARPSSQAEPVDLQLRHEPRPERGSQQQAAPISQPAQQPSSSRAGKYFAIAAVCVAVSAVAAYWWGAFPWVKPADPPAPNTRIVTAPQPQPQPPAPAASPSPSPSPPAIDPQLTRANELVQEGQRLLGESQLDQARAKFQQALALAATPEAQNGLAEVDRRQASLAAAEQAQAKAKATAAEVKRLEEARKSSIDRFTEGQAFEQQRQYDAADAKYREAISADKNNKEAAAALGRSEQYRKAKAAGLSALSAKNREAALRALGEARKINSVRFASDGLDKTWAEAERLAGATVQPKPAPALTNDQLAIVAVLQNLAKALSSRTNSSHSLTAVRQVWPGAGGNVFGDNESQEFIFRNPVFVSPTADRASVDCERIRAMTPRSTGKTSVLYDSVRIELRKASGAWQVVSVSER